MRLTSVTVENFRCFDQPATMPIDSLTAIIGRNDSGKSSLLEALAIFFGVQSADAGDHNVKHPDSPLRIACTFDHLPDSVVLDAAYPTTLAQEYLLNENGHLEIVKEISGKTQKVFLRAKAPGGKNYSDLHSLKMSDLKARAEAMKVPLASADKRVASELRQAIWHSASDLELGTRLIPVDGKGAVENAKAIWTQLEGRMPGFALFKSDRPSTDQDEEAQDPMNAAVQEALKAQQSALDIIANEVTAKVKSIADATVAKVREMDPKLGSTLDPDVKPEKWKFKVSLAGDNGIPLNKRGSGVRRLVLLNFFRAKAERLYEGDDSCGVIYAIEEPETSQHPNYQRMLMQALAEISERPGCQVLLTTHTPALGGMVPIKSLRYVRVEDNSCRTLLPGGEETYKAVANALGVLPDHRVRIFVAVEGMNDIQFLTRISAILHQDDPSLPDLGAMERRDELLFVPTGGGNLRFWTHRLAPFLRPEFHLYDLDTGDKTRQQKEMIDKVNQRGGDCCGCLTTKREMENYLHPDAIDAASRNRGSGPLQLCYGDHDDVPTLVASTLHDRSADKTKDWKDLTPEQQKRKAGIAKQWLNREAVELMTPAQIDAQDPTGDIRSWLRQIGDYAMRAVAVS